MTPRILIIAGSDSGGGAGLQADVKTVTMLGGHAMTAVTALTAQNTLGVQRVMPVPADMVMAQIGSCVDDIGVDAVKIGMLGSAETAHAVADWLAGAEVPVVFDPVMVATSGAALADAATRRAMDRLAGAATVLTPNTDELAALAGFPVADEIAQEHAARTVMERTGCPNLLAKGSHLPGGRVFDFLYGSGPENPGYIVWDDARIATRHTHGTGCTLASAVAVGLAEGMPLPDAVARARGFVRAAILAAPGFGSGHGPMGQQAVRRDPDSPRRNPADEPQPGR